MNVILVAGGSGGHIYPCLELAKYFKEKNHKVLLCGSLNSLEEKIYKENNFEFKGIKIEKKKLISYFKNCKEIKKIYKDFNPSVVILFGNYISFSFGVSAILKKIPIYLHEQNVIYGNCNKLLGFKARKIYLSLPIKDDIYRKKSLLLGNPKSDVLNNKTYVYKNKYNVLIVMGSLGSTTINTMLKKFIDIANSDIDYHIVVGNKYYDQFIKGINKRNNIHLYPYLDNLSAYLKGCDVFISRAGATTISEILVNGVTSILIPSPYVKNNHQYKNAKYLEENNACVLIKEEELSASILNDNINELIGDYSKCMKIKENARKLAIRDAKRKIYEDIIKDYEG